MTFSVDGKISLCACSKIKDSNRSSDIEARMAFKVRSTLENTLSGSHDETGSDARILSIQKMLGNTVF